MGHVLVWSLAFLLLNTLLCEQAKGDNEESLATDCQADIAFLLDGSGSMTSADFEKMKNFVYNLISAFVGINARFAIAQFSSRQMFTTHYYFNNFHTNGSWESQFTSINHLGGLTDTANAIRRVVNDIFVASRGSRNNVKKVLIVITDGRPTDRDLGNAVQVAQAKQIIRFAIGVGRAFDDASARNELNIIGSLPSSDHVFQVENFNALDQIRITLLDNILTIKVSNMSVVTLEPNWSEVYRGEKITLRCQIHRGDREWEHEWITPKSTLNKTQSEIRITEAYSDLTGNYSCRGKMKQCFSTNWSDIVTLTVTDGKPRPVLIVSPSWLNPGASVNLACHVEHPSAGWRFYWYEAVPNPVDEKYRYELLPDSSEGTEQQVFTIYGQKNTRGYVCRAGRGEPQFYSEYSQLKFTWSGDMDSSVSLRVSPNRSQHFTSESISLSCETNSIKWRVRQFYDNRYSNCDNYQWKTYNSSPCIVSRTVHSGTVFWCESTSGQLSNAVNISTHGDIILESPVHPVTEGQPLILSCRLRTDTNLYVSFYKNGELIQTGTSKTLKFSAVSKSDEGLYRCEIQTQRSQVWMSLESWLSVKSVTIKDTPPFPVLLIIGLVSGILLMILLLLLALGWYKTSKGLCWNRFMESQGSNQGQFTAQTIKQDKNQLQVYSSLLHGDLCIYESIHTSRNTADGEDEYECILSPHHGDAENEDYCNVKPHN